MDAARLEKIGRQLCPGDDWKAGLAAKLNVNLTTVWRWVQRNKVPPPVAIGLECLAKEKK